LVFVAPLQLYSAIHYLRLGELDRLGTVSRSLDTVNIVARCVAITAIIIPTFWFVLVLFTDYKLDKQISPIQQAIVVPLFISSWFTIVFSVLRLGDTLL
jgi:hypothetical protein